MIPIGRHYEYSVGGTARRPSAFILLRRRCLLPHNRGGLVRLSTHQLTRHSVVGHDIGAGHAGTQVREKIYARFTYLFGFDQLLRGDVCVPVRKTLLFARCRVDKIFPNLGPAQSRRQDVDPDFVLREFDRGVVDMGLLEGVKEGDELVIVKKGRLKLMHDAVGFTYADDDVVGTFTVTAVDENVSDGMLVTKSFFDLINPGDSVVFPPVAPEQQEPAAEVEGQGLWRRLFGAA